jgi:predicted RNase H-like HicB family nuclease
MPDHYTVSDGTLVLFLWPAEEGGYNVTSPLDPALITQAETLEEAFVMAYDAWECLQQYRSDLARRPEGATSANPKARRDSPAQRSARSPGVASLKPTSSVSQPPAASHVAPRRRRKENTSRGATPRS